METDVPMRSGGWMDDLFDWCVRLLLHGAKLLGISYDEINIWIFCIIWPIFTLVLIALVFWLFKKNRALKKQLLSLATNTSAP